MIDNLQEEVGGNEGEEEELEDIIRTAGGGIEEVSVELEESMPS